MGLTHWLVVDRLQAIPQSPVKLPMDISSRFIPLFGFALLASQVQSSHAVSSAETAPPLRQAAAHLSISAMPQVSEGTHGARLKTKPQSDDTPTPIILNGVVGQELKTLVNLTPPTGATVGALRVTPSWLTARLTPRNASSPMKNVQIALTGSPDAPAGAFTGSIECEMVGADSKTILIPLSGFIADGITMEPQVVVLGTVAPRAKITRQIVVRSQGNRAFKIAEVKTPDIQIGDSHVKVKMPLQKNEVHHVLALEVTASEKDGPVNSTIVVVLDNGRELTLAITGAVDGTSNSAECGCYRPVTPPAPTQ
jgi:hypothetical protein